MTSAATTAIVNARSATRASASVARTVKEKEPTVVAVPVMRPLAASSLKPAGRAPAEIDHVYGARPPVAATAASSQHRWWCSAGSWS